MPNSSVVTVAMAAAGAFLVPTLVTYDAMERRGAELGMAAVSRQKNSEVDGAFLALQSATSVNADCSGGRISDAFRKAAWPIC